MVCGLVKYLKKSQLNSEVLAFPNASRLSLCPSIPPSPETMVLSLPSCLESEEMASWMAKQAPGIL